MVSNLMVVEGLGETVLVGTEDKVIAASVAFETLAVGAEVIGAETQQSLITGESAELFQQLPRHAHVAHIDNGIILECRDTGTGETWKQAVKVTNAEPIPA